MKAIIFDFNGTMVYDSHLHEKAWIEVIRQYNKEATDQEIAQGQHGLTNAQIIADWVGPVSPHEELAIGNRKELLYQEQARQEELQLVEGLQDFLDHLVTKEIPFAIATSSPQINIPFYLDYFGLDQWFEEEMIIYNDGSIPGKPAGDIYQLAAQKLGLKAEECIIIEDSMTGVEAANRAGAGKIIVTLSSPDQQASLENSPWRIDGFIEDFKDFKSLL